MVVLLDFASLLVVLNAACSVAPQTQEKDSPIVNVTLDSMRKILSWNSRRNVTQQECTIVAPPDLLITQDPQVREDSTYVCTLYNAVLHRGATLTVNATSDGRVFQHVLPFHNPGKAGSAAENFSCVIYDICFMNCSWTPGPAAPADVRYYLYTWASLYGNVSECGRYILDSAGTRVGCHFDELGKPHGGEEYFFLVNGTSDDTDIQFLDFPPFKARNMEKYNPPANLTIEYNASTLYYTIQWDNPEIRATVSNSILCYELDIQKKHSLFKRDPVFQRGGDKNEYLMPRSAVTGEHTIRVRVKHTYNKIWSEWSCTQHFGFPENNFLVVLIGLVLGAAVLSGMGLMFLCKRFSLRKKLFPPIPQVKQEIAGRFMYNLEETALDGGDPPPGSQDPEDVLTVEETLSLASGQAETAGPAPAPKP